MVEKHDGVVFRETIERDLEAAIYRPADAKEAPAIVLVHGGGWESDHRGMFEGHLTRLAEQGYVGADITHRLSDDATFPAPIEDVKYAIRWLKSRADAYGLDPGRVAVGGHSSGAHLAALAATAPDHSVLDPEDGPEESSAVAGAVPMHGPHDLRKLGATDPNRLFISDFVRRFIGAPFAECPEAYRLASPIDHVDGSEPPFLLMTSTNDEEVPLHESVALRDRVEAAGGRAHLYVADGGDHVCLTEGNSHYEEGMERVEAFLDRHL